MLKTKIVEGFKFIPQYPIIAAVINNGKILGNKLIKTILPFLNIIPINVEIIRTVSSNDITRFEIKVSTPFATITPIPVKE